MASALATLDVVLHQVYKGTDIFHMLLKDLPKVFYQNVLPMHCLAISQSFPFYSSLSVNEVQDQVIVTLKIWLVCIVHNCDLLCENRPFRHIWYFEKYHFETLEPLQFSCAVF